MQARDSQPLAELVHRFSDYLPTLAAGFVVLVLGLAGGWVVKRAVVRVLVWLRLDRLAGRVGWRAAFGKGDVRAALYNGLGNIAMAVVVLFFFDDALKRWGLTVVARVIDAFVFYLPNLALVALIVAVGVMIANAASERVAKGLAEEGFAHARLMAKIFKSALLTIVAVMALWQLEFARQIVLAAFLIAFGALGVAFALAVGLGSARALERGWDSLFEKRDESRVTSEGS
jgi:hypothetical protein